MKWLLGLLVVLLFAAAGCDGAREGSPSASGERVGRAQSALTLTDVRPSNQSVCCFGQGGTIPTFGQVLTVPATDVVLRSFGLEMIDVPATVIFRGEVYAWDGAEATGPALYESGPLSTNAATQQTVTVDTGGLTLTAGAQVVVFVTSSRDAGGAGSGNFGSRSDDPYAGGGLVTFSGTPAQWTGLAWTPSAGVDASFAARFEAPPPVASTTSLVSSVNPSVFGQSVTFTASVTGGAGVADGSVTFKDGATTLGTVTLNGAGQASLSTSSLTVASHSITAVYGGSGTYLTSTSAALSQGVGKASTTTALASSLNPSIVGGSVTFTATVSALSPGAGTPSGNATFRDGATVLGTTALDGTGVATFTTSALGAGSHAIAADYGSDARFAASTAPTVTQVVNADGATLALASSLDPSSFGGSVTFTATVTSTGSGGTPTGTVNFKDSGAVLGTGTLNGAGVATFSTSALAAGSHSIGADYGGDTRHTAASGGLTQVVNAGASTTVSASLTNPSAFGQSVTFTAKVTGTGGVPTGTATFLDGATPLATSALNGAGQTSFATGALAVGSHSITVQYSGDANFAPGTSNVTTQQVTKAATATSLITSNSPSIAGSSVTFTATVAATAPGAGTPAGTLTFRDGATVLSTATLSAGVATFSTSTLAVGTHVISAVYAGNASFATSTSSNVSQVVNQDGVAAALVSSLSPSTFGTSVTFTATVSSVGPSGTPTGNVAFKDGATTLGTTALDGTGVATFSTAALAGGSHTITAQYAGDAKHATASASIAQIVGVAGAALDLTSAINPSVFGQSVTWTATVTSTAAGTRTGTVSFVDGASLLGTSTVNAAGVATFSSPALSVAAHMISGSYSGDGNYAPSTSTALSQAVNVASTTTSLASSSTPSLVGTSITFTATVSAVAPGAGTRTGTVSFMDGATVLGTGTLNASGVATFAVATLAAGTHHMTAVYGGDGSFDTSTSASFTQNVSASAATLSLTSAPASSTFGEAVKLSAKVMGSSGTPTGSVTFSDGATELGTSTLDGTGLATLSIATLAAGTHSITARYSGSSTYAWVVGSTSQVVTKAPTTTTVKSSLDPSPLGDAVTFTVTVASSAAGFTGQVELFDGTTSLGKAALKGAAATFAVSTLTVGSHVVSATYHGDASFLPSTAAMFQQNVSSGQRTGVVGPEADPGPAGAGNGADAGACGCRVTGGPVGLGSGGGAAGLLLALAGALAVRLRRRSLRA